MSAMMNQIEIPVDHFFRAAPRSYSDWLSAVIREFQQNCVDAGATKIVYNFDKAALTLTVTDNGTGCTADDIKDKLLTLGGSGKVGDTGSTGGFGVAKEILYFPWAEWSIRTRDVLVVGSGSRYHDPETVPGPGFSGFEAKILFPDSQSFDRMLYRAATYLHKCENPQAEVWVNETKIESQVVKGRLARQFSWADVFVSEDESNQDCYAHVRKNGVEMFSTYVGDHCPQVIFEITIPSTDVLTSNRDGFRSEDSSANYQEEFQQFIRQLIVDKKQAVRDNIEHTELIRGEEGVLRVEDPYLRAETPEDAARLIAGRAGRTVMDAFNDASYQATQIYDQEDVERCLETIQNGFDQAKAEVEDLEQGKLWVDCQNEIAQDFMKRAREEADSGETYTAADILKLMGQFPDVVVKWRGDDRKSVQKILNLKSVHVVLKTWAEFLKLVMLYAGNYGQFKVGVGINLDGAEALYYREHGIHHFLIDPMVDENGNPGRFKISNRFAADEILDRAIHEVAHVRCRYHDVEFSTEVDRIRRALRPHMSRFQSIFNVVRWITPKVSERE